jgi:dipeptidyl aminopeptidase/acylaminoacyl peptidase
VDTPPISVLRSARDGRVIATLEQADAGAVYAAGWRPPLRTHVKAADGKTDIYGVIYFPPDYHKDGQYPVIDAFYGGPQLINAPRDFNDAVHSFNPVSRSSLAQLGFIVVTFDARGTPGRSKAYHDVGYGDFADPQIEDQVAAIKQLAQRYGGFDLGHVGVYGHSFGGYTSTRAILSHPEFFKVAVSSAGPQNWQGFGQDLQSAIGIPVYSDGSRFRPTPTAIPEVYKELDNATLAGNLRGHLMLVYGDMDENAFPAVTLQLADALEKANKTFDLLYLPNRTHSYFRTDAYYTRRMWDYFVSNLALRQPPENYALKSPAGK